ncbi:MAG: hypothetical protein ABI427_08180 [Solirubrobacteraceae bacterium]
MLVSLAVDGDHSTRRNAWSHPEDFRYGSPRARVWTFGTAGMLVLAGGMCAALVPVARAGPGAEL